MAAGEIGVSFSLSRQITAVDDNDAQGYSVVVLAGVNMADVDIVW